MSHSAACNQLKVTFIWCRQARARAARSHAAAPANVTGHINELDHFETQY
jgi:hypothetical protein